MNMLTFLTGMGGLMILNMALGFYIIKLRHKIAYLEDKLEVKENL